MMDWLVFGLSATLSSMGDLAGHERRGSLIWPGRSAVIGLMGAAMGLRRSDDFSALEALEISVAIFDTGAPLRDFHTVQTVPSAAVKRPHARPEALATAHTGQINTAITIRDYRSSVLYGVAASGPADTLDKVAQALHTPAFHLYLGRKSCPLSAPPAPQRIGTDTAEAALSHLHLPPWRTGAVASMLICDAKGTDTSQGTYREMRHDVALSRQHWHFTTREVALHRVSIQPGEGSR